MRRDPKFDVLVLAAGRGPDDPMAKAFSVRDKCLVPAGGEPMIARVVRALKERASVRKIAICIDDLDAARPALSDQGELIYIPSASTAPGSVLQVLEEGNLDYPVLVTTADHALLTPEMLDHFLSSSAALNTDLTAGLADRVTIEAEMPDTKRTYLPFSDRQVSGCNLFAVMNANALEVVRFWQQADKNRKKPWKLIGAFGLRPLLLWLAGRLTLERAFEIGSARLGAKARPVLMPFGRAAVDVDKPEDKELVDRLLSDATRSS